MGEESNSYVGAIPAAIGLVGDVANMYYDARQSDAARQWASDQAMVDRVWQAEMYNRQLTDNINWRTHQELYNSPAAQMQRFADAGINPMYMVTGANGGATMHSPSISGGFGSTPATPHSTTGRINVTEAVRLNNETRIARGQEDLLKAEARKANAEAQNEEYGHGYGSYMNEVWSTFHNISDGIWNRAQDYAHFMAAAREYDWDMMDMSFQDAKANFEHSKEVRAFARDLNEHKRSLFEHELSQAQSAAHVFAVAARWALANQFINAGSEIIGAATGLARAFKVPQTTIQKTITNNSADYSERHIYGDYHYKQQKTTINDPNW